MSHYFKFKSYTWDEWKEMSSHLMDITEEDYTFDDEGHIIAGPRVIMKRHCESIISYFLNYKGSIRQCSKESNLSKSQIHRIIHTYILKFYPEEYDQIKRILRRNRIERGKPRKYWR